MTNSTKNVQFTLWSITTINAGSEWSQVETCEKYTFMTSRFWFKFLRMKPVRTNLYSWMTSNFLQDASYELKWLRTKQKLFDLWEFTWLHWRNSLLWQATKKINFLSRKRKSSVRKKKFRSVYPESVIFSLYILKRIDLWIANLLKSIEGEDCRKIFSKLKFLKHNFRSPV